MDYSTDLWQAILETSDLISQIRLIQVCSHFNNYLRITDFRRTNLNNPKNVNRLTNDILKYYPYITKLNLLFNIKVDDVNHLNYLQELYVGPTIDNDGISHINLNTICMTHNSKITNLNHMSKLKVLIDNRHVFGHVKLDDNGIKKLNLIVLHVDDNQLITDISHMNNLTILFACGSNCGINDNSIKNLNLIELHAFNNHKITNVNHMTNLRKLYAGAGCGISNKGIENLNLVEIYANHNSKINFDGVKHMNNLKYFNKQSIASIESIKNNRKLSKDFEFIAACCNRYGLVIITKIQNTFKEVIITVEKYNNNKTYRTSMRKAFYALAAYIVLNNNDIGLRIKNTRRESELFNISLTSIAKCFRIYMNIIN